MNQEATQMLHNRVPRRKKPYALQRKFIMTGRRLANWREYTNIDFYDIRALIEQRDRHDKYARERAFIGIRGQFIYCPECGKRLSVAQAVVSRKDPDYLSCFGCATRGGHNVWTVADIRRLPAGVTYDDAGVEFYQ